MSADYLREVFYAFMLLTPWLGALFFVLPTLLFFLIRLKQKRREERVCETQGLVTWMTTETHTNDVAKTAITLQDHRKNQMKWVFVGKYDKLPVSVKVGSVVRIKYLLPPDSKGLYLQVEALEVTDLDMKVFETEQKLLSLRVLTRDIRGGELPEGTRDELG